MILKLNTTNFIHLDPDLLAQEGHSPTDVVKEHHRRNCFPRALDPEQLHSARQELPVEVARAPGVNRRRSAHKTATHISVDLVIVLFRVDVTCHVSRVTVTCHNVCCI